MASFLIAAILFVTTEAAKNLAGKAFTDPSQHVRMPADWQELPVKYEDWAQGADLAVSLDQHLYPALLPFIKTYAKKHGLDIAVQEGTCGISAGLLARKAVDIAGFCCPPGETDRLPALRFNTVGIGALAMLVHPDNPIDNITFDQSRQIFQGKIYRWSELKNSAGQQGPDVTIQTIGRLHCKSRPGHWRSLLDNEDVFSPRLHDVGTIQDVIRQVSFNTAAIGGFETLFMNDRYQQKRKLKPLRIDGLSPGEPEHLISSRYPLYFTFNLTTWERKGAENPNAQKLLDYLLQHAGNIDSRLGIIPASRLKKAGWKFEGNELIGEPQ